MKYLTIPYIADRQTATDTVSNSQTKSKVYMVWYNLAHVVTFCSLTWNKISDDGARALSGVLKVNQSLHKLE